MTVSELCDAMGVEVQKQPDGMTGRGYSTVLDGVRVIWIRAEVPPAEREALIRRLLRRWMH